MASERDGLFDTFVRLEPQAVIRLLNPITSTVVISTIQVNNAPFFIDASKTLLNISCKG